MFFFVFTLRCVIYHYIDSIQLKSSFRYCYKRQLTVVRCVVVFLFDLLVVIGAGWGMVVRCFVSGLFDHRANLLRMLGHGPLCWFRRSRCYNQKVLESRKKNFIACLEMQLRIRYSFFSKGKSVLQRLPFLLPHILERVRKGMLGIFLTSKYRATRLHIISNHY